VQNEAPRARKLTMHANQKFSAISDDVEKRIILSSAEELLTAQNIESRSLTFIDSNTKRANLSVQAPSNLPLSPRTVSLSKRKVAYLKNDNTIQFSFLYSGWSGSYRIIASRIPSTTTSSHAKDCTSCWVPGEQYHNKRRRL